jgi:hypothetical protein
MYFSNNFLNTHNPHSGRKSNFSLNAQIICIESPQIPAKNMIYYQNSYEVIGIEFQSSTIVHKQYNNKILLF